MKHFFNLLGHEIRSLFTAPATYTAAVLFLLLMGWLYWWVLLQCSLEPQDDLPTAMFFQLFWLPVFFMVPLLTMKSIAEERRRGTLETLLTTPANVSEIVLSKFAASYLLYLGLWVMTLGFPLLVSAALDEKMITSRLLDFPTLSGGLAFVAVSGLLFISVGIFASSLTQSQLVAGMLSFCILFIIIIGLNALQDAATSWQPWFRETIDYMQIFRHLEEFSRGMIDTRPFFFYISNSALVLGLAVIVVESKA